MKAKLFVAISVGLIVLLVASSLGLFAAQSDNPGRRKKPDKQKPVHATDVELVKKITLRGRPEWAGGGKGRKKKEAATGQLGEPVSGERYAVVVGISDYPGDDSDLEYSDDDAIEMYDALTGVYGFDSTNVTLLTDLDATRSAILTAIDDIPTDADEIVFFFSGHSMRGIAEDDDKEKKDEAIVAHNGEVLIEIWDGELREQFAGLTASVIIFIFDTCLAGGMKSDLGGSDRVIVMATTENGLAYEIPALENGEFSYYFVDEGILQGEANTHDYNGDGVLKEPEQVTVEEAYDYAKANCNYDRPTIDDSFEDDLLP